MAKIDYIKLSKERTDGKAELIVRFYVSKTFRPQFKSGLFINPERFKSLDDTDRCRRYEIEVPREGTQNFAEIKDIKATKRKFTLFLERLQAICDVTAERHKDELTKEWIDNALRIISRNNVGIEDITYSSIRSLIEEEKTSVETERINASKKSFFEYMVDFRDNSKKKVNGKREGEKSDVWKKNFDVLIRALRRYEAFIRLSDKNLKDFTLDIDTINCETIEDIESFLRNEYQLAEDYPKIFARFPSSTDKRRKPQPRGRNAICTLFSKLKAFFSWLRERGITTNDPFRGFEGITTEKYGTPIYINLTERNIIADFDLSDKPSLETQRDIFIFQCCLGCRVSDLMRLTYNNLIDGAIEYIPSKTKKEKQNVVRVPLNNRALKLVEKYRNVDASNRLFPFISYQKYNDSIKVVFEKCGITRMVTILNPVTGNEEQKPINEVASSHMARRTFVGNLYKQVKDPSLVGALSGHAEGSRAFSRYRTIDEGTKKELVGLIE